jgi:hypothetical protein
MKRVTTVMNEILWRKLAQEKNVTFYHKIFFWTVFNFFEAMFTSVIMQYILLL